MTYAKIESMKFFRKLSKYGFAKAAGLLFILIPVVASAQVSDPLNISIEAKVNQEGKVGISLTLKNEGSTPLFHIHPMLHFHHTMTMLDGIHRLDAGDSVTIENNEHPPVRLPGSYPLVAMVGYKPDETADPVSTVHTGSFFFKEALPSEIKGSILTSKRADDSLLRVVLKNESTSFKNVRMMLVLPPGIKAEQFQSMKGFTLRSGEEKSFDIQVKKNAGLPSGQFPVHMLLEYGQMLKHYSGDIPGTVNFGPFWGAGPLLPQMLVFLFLSYGIFKVLRRRNLENLS
ncbi:MAG: hypothetical protein G3M70_14750 [Candidatus Nitronauta litoralis]|uniref:Uncharacterized protein n=1 Tax=Candidatus Nitronauta litoralis TaxID=2705533 RepID=A0A7T0G105_9BACT|nr:MAG: hypothetical protein G3M70_14750 [Candidatus Nitronauta litoralis]